MEQLPGDATAERCFEESHDTALCLIPPPQLWGPVNALRSLNDEKFTKWPPHITLVYPFVTPEALPDVAEALCRNKIGSLDDDISINLEEAGFFHIVDEQVKHLSELRDQIHRFLGRPRGREYRPHLTLAQSEDTQASWHQFLLEKARLLTPLVWHTRQLAVMIRDPVSPNSAGASRPMRLWGYIDLASHSLVRDAATLAAIPSLPVGASLPRPQATFHHNGVNMSWEPLSDSITNADIEPTPLNRLVIASYNVLAEFDWPASSSRYPALVGNILSERASADILVLQEVTDQFLSFLLADSNIRSQYPYTTHGPPDQHGIAPLPSHLNTVVLSKLPFQWEYLRSFKHKGFGILEFPTVQTGGPSESPLKPLVLAACHLSRGLTDAALATKRDEIKKLVEYLNSSFPQHPWVLAGDFNLASSSHTIDQALKKGEISEKGLECLEEIEAIVSKAGLQDTWLVSRVGPGESSSTTGSHESNLGLYEGEQGATFDPISNSLAAASIGAGGSRPQRYDRILVTKSAQLQPYGFNMFGQVMDANEITSQDPASDHWGIRCLLVPSPPNAGVESSSNSKFQGISLRKAALTLGSFDELKDSLVSNGQFPTASDAELRQEAIALLQRTLLENDTTAAEAEKRSHVQLVLIPVGSFGLGVWTSLSDIDCLCVGNISSKTFFSLAVQKLKKASTSGIKILRRVMANTGTMLELEIHGIRFDLQYCAAAAIAQGYPDVLKRPASDPVFSLPVQSIAKLKPARDLVYLRRSIPDMTKYRVAHLFIKAWAQSRASSASISTVNALASELTRAAALLSQDGMTWSKFLGLELSGTPSSLIEKGAADFLDSYRTYIKISARYWGSSQQKGRKYLGWLESRFISILVDISRKTLGLVPRIWPARFIDEDQTSGTSDENSELSACYLIGLKWVDSIADKSATSQAAAEGNIRVILQEFESRVQKSDKYYDSENCWMSASIMRRSSLGPVRLAPGQLYEYDGTDTDLDDDDESDLEEGNEPESEAYVSKKDSRSLKTGASKSTSESSKPAGAGKLRSAVDAMNRIRWDSGMDSSDYLVGYEDRFLGAQEKALDNWRTEQTDEEFIPQHRILYFRRKSDGAIVWDRRTRVDTIFGSG
ncbi:hypothetical protein TrVFT333_001102 [Trichoderma virens FT-333]|nr:hypothetical protein TrVFT333_001102 [Trichoderma virens FT-333]